MSKSFTANLQLNSSTLFPTNAAVTNLVTQVVSGSAGFDVLVVSQSSTKNLFLATEADASSTVYFYAQAPTTNPDSLILSVTGSNTSGSSVIILRPGDWTYFPFHVSASGCTIRAVNTSTTSSLLNVFYGARS